ncbi:MAG: leucine-rich repeat domain-containing protein [Rikenellaceae bacterium]
MKKLLILTAALFAAISCTKEEADPEVVITTLTGTEFTLSQFEVHTFPATDVWVIEDQSATASDFAGLSAAIEYISSSDATRQIELEFSNLTSIPAYAIYGVSISNATRDFTALSSLSAPYVASVGAYAFEFCDGLTELDMPNVEYVGSYAFRGCSSLKEVDMPYASVIEYAAFNNCSSLVSVDVPLLESVADQTFAYCTSLSYISLPVAESIGSSAFSYNYSLETISAPEVVTIAERAFSDCLVLDSIDAPQLEEIGDYAFISCESLENFTITSLVSSLGVGVFNNCSMLTDIVDQSEGYLFESGVLYNADQTEVVIALQSVVEGDLTLSESVTSIRARAFYNCSLITSVTIPSVEVISEAAFAHCTAITEATVSAATTLEDNAFYNCLIMTTFTAPEVTSIGSKSFYNCERLVDFYLATNPDVVIEELDVHAFHSCPIEYATLTVGAANADNVTYGDTLNVGLYSYEFDSIVVLES